MSDSEDRRGLSVVDRRSGAIADCVVTHRRAGEERSIEVELRGPIRLRATSSVDFEEALTDLRSELEQHGLLLLCNRYRIDAFASSMSRQMSDGLSCYIVEPGRPVDPSQLVDALAPAPRTEVVTAAVADRFVAQWIESFNE